ncbi:MAG: hypothetical protein RR734_05085 [Bacilli bacterium]
MSKFKCKIEKSSIPIILILVIAAIMRIAVLSEMNVDYNLASDDLSYINSAITFVHTGQITMHGVLSAQIMPGMPLLLAPFILCFGTGTFMWMGVKALWILMGLLSIYFVYRIVCLYANRYYGALAAFFFLSIDFAWMDNLILTETPFMFSFILLIYLSLKLGKTQEKKYYWLIIVTYIFCLLIRPTIAPYPIFLFVYLYFCKYDMKLMFQQILIAGGILSCIIVPWTIRNYIQFDAFVPLTYGMGNPKLMGTYQGVGFPLDKDLDYEKNVIANMPKEMKHYYNNGKWLDHYMSKYYSLELDGMKADYRMSYWWEHDKKSMLKSYLIYKPYGMVYNSFYWATPFNISDDINMLFRKVDLFLCFFATIGILLNRRRIKELLLIASFYIFQIIVYSYSFSFSRYAQTLYFIRYIIIGMGLYELWQYLLNRKKKQQIIKVND